MPDKKCQHDNAIESSAHAAIEAMRHYGIAADYDAIIRFVESLNHTQRMTMIGIVQTVALAMGVILAAYEEDTDDSEPDGPPPPFSGRMH